MTNIYGKYIPCNDKIINCQCEYIHCEHTDSILRQYGAGIYEDTSVILKIIRIILSYQEDSIKKICDFNLDLKALVDSTGFKLCNKNNIIDQGCETICNNNYQKYIFDNSCLLKCEDVTLSNETYLNILKSIDYFKYPNRNNIKKICDIFGWSMFYTTDYLNIVINNDNIFDNQSILTIIPTPIGENLRILKNC